MPLWFQLGMGMNAAQAGGVLIMSTTGALLTRFIAIPLMRLVHPRYVAIAGTAMLAASVLFTASLRPDWPLAVFYLALVCQGLLVSTPLLVIGAAAYVDIGPEQAGAATGFYTTVQQLTLSLGVTAAVCTSSAVRRFGHLTATDSATYSNTLLVLSLLAVAALWPAWKLDKSSIGALRAGPRQTAAGRA
jgi:Na+/melibiose symporter-like transporter